MEDTLSNILRADKIVVQLSKKKNEAVVYRRLQDLPGTNGTSPRLEVEVVYGHPDYNKTSLKHRQKRFKARGREFYFLSDVLFLALYKNAQIE